MTAEKELSKAIPLSSPSELGELYYQRSIVLAKSAQWEKAITGKIRPSFDFLYYVDLDFACNAVGFGPRYLQFAHQRQKLKSFVESYASKLDSFSNSDLPKNLISYLLDPFLQLEKERFLDYFALSLCKPFIVKFSSWEECRSEVWKIHLENIKCGVGIQEVVGQIFEGLCEKLKDKVVEWIHQFCSNFQLEEVLGMQKARETICYLVNFVQKNFVEMFQQNCQHLVVSCLHLKLSNM